MLLKHDLECLFVLSLKFLSQCSEVSFTGLEVFYTCKVQKYIWVLEKCLPHLSLTSKLAGSTLNTDMLLKPSSHMKSAKSVK